MLQCFRKIHLITLTTDAQRRSKCSTSSSSSVFVTCARRTNKIPSRHSAPSTIRLYTKWHDATANCYSTKIEPKGEMVCRLCGSGEPNGDFCQRDVVATHARRHRCRCVFLFSNFIVAQLRTHTRKRGALLCHIACFMRDAAGNTWKKFVSCIFCDIGGAGAAADVVARSYCVVRYNTIDKNWRSFLCSCGSVVLVVVLSG